MNSSSTALANKIMHFEQNYVATYLHDESRLENCQETLEQLMKRQLVIGEMKVKVMMYKESLKTLTLRLMSLVQIRLHPQRQVLQQKKNQILRSTHKYLIRRIRILQELLFKYIGKATRNGTLERLPKRTCGVGQMDRADSHVDKFTSVTKMESTRFTLCTTPRCEP